MAAAPHRIARRPRHALPTIAPLAVVALLLVGCSEPAQPAPSATGRWACPPRWVPYAQGGCGPAALLCASGGGAAPGACSSSDGTRAERIDDPDHGWGITLHRRSDGSLGGAWRAPGSGDGPPSTTWAPEGVPDGDWSPVAGIPSCPAGWVRRDDGTCDPGLPIDCPEGSFALPGGRCTPTSARDCPTGEWADVSSEAAGAMVLRVRSGAETSTADGSASHPFATLSAALERAVPGTWVLVARGVWRESVLVDRSLHIVGTCAERVTLAGVESSDGLALPTVQTAGTGTVFELRGVTVTGGVVGVLARDGAHVTVRSARIDRATHTGVLARGSGTEAVVSDVAITNGRLHSDGTRGHGVVATLGATVTIDRAHLSDNRGYGVEVSSAGSSLTARDVVVRSTRQSSNGTGVYGAGAAVSAGARATLERAVLSGNAVMGVFVTGSGSQITLGDAVVADTQPQTSGRVVANGMGLVAHGQGRLEGRRVELRGNNTAGLIALERAEATLTDSVVRDVRRAFSGTAYRGWGVLCATRARATLTRVRVEDCDGVGASAEDAGSALVGDDVVIARTRLLPDATAGGGVVALHGGSVTLRGARVADSRLAGAVATGEGSVLALDRAVVRGTEPLPEEPLNAVGLAARHEGRVTASSVRVTDNFGTGALADTAGELSLSDCVIARTAHSTEVAGRPDAFAGLGLLAAVQGRVTAERVALIDNARFGALCGDEGSELSFSEGVIRGTGVSAEVDDAAITFALAATRGGRVTASRATLADNRVTVAALADGAALSIVDGAVTRTQPTRRDASGQGVQATHGATLALARTLVDEVRTVGVSVYGEGTRALLTDVAVTRTGFGPFAEIQAAGVGLLVGIGASATARRMLVRGAGQVGVWSVDGGSALELDDLIVLDVAPVVHGARRAFGCGLVAQSGARVVARRVAVVGSRGLALGAVLEGAGASPRVTGARLEAADVFARSVVAEAIQYGAMQSSAVAYGLHVATECSADVTRAVFDDGEWGFFHSSGTLALRDAVVARQRRGAGASNGTSSDRPLVLERVRFVEVASGVARDIALPEALLPAPPLP